MPSVYGTYGTIDGRPVLRFDRRLAQPVDAVWRALSEPGELAHWFPAAVAGELRPAGRLTFTFPGDGAPTEGEITELDPPRALAFSWGDEHLRFELDPVDGGRGCELRFSCVLAEREQAARDAAGWHVCLDRLERHLGGASASAPGPEPTREWRERYEAYAARGLPTGAPVPEGDPSRSRPAT